MEGESRKVREIKDFIFLGGDNSDCFYKAINLPCVAAGHVTAICSHRDVSFASDPPIVLPKPPRMHEEIGK